MRQRNSSDVLDWLFCYNRVEEITRKGHILMKNAFMARQGDVLFTKVEQLPEGLERQKSNIIVEGETTGHAHRLETGVIWASVLGVMYLEVVKATRIVHEEHNPITLEPGMYKVTRQREYVAPDIERMVLD